MVAPPAGAWIETRRLSGYCYIVWSRPPRARGLKLYSAMLSRARLLSRPPRARGLKLAEILRNTSAQVVAPPAGAWIETTAAIMAQAV